MRRSLVPALLRSAGVLALIVFATRLLMAQGDVWHVLDVPLIGQQYETWCYAACAQMAAEYFQPGAIEQCTAVSRATHSNPSDDITSAVSRDTHLECCGVEPTRSSCASASTDKRCFCEGGSATSLLRDANFVSVPAADHVLNFDELDGQMYRNTGGQTASPVITSFYWFGGGSHNVVVRGTIVSDGDPFVVVNDPLPCVVRTVSPGEPASDQQGGDVWVYPFESFERSARHTRHPNGGIAVDCYNIKRAPSAASE